MQEFLYFPISTAQSAKSFVNGTQNTMNSAYFPLFILFGISLWGKSPNVLFIAVDDLRPEIGCYGSRAVTPNLDRFAESALQFNRAYCNQAVCGASRVSLMTGLYPEFTNERTYHVTDWRKRWAGVTTLNQHFGNHGYTTVGIGKVYHGSDGPGVDPDNWTEWVVPAKGAEYANSESFEAQKEAQATRPPRARGNHRGPSTEASRADDDFHYDGQRANLGREYIQKLTKSDKPFFLAIGFTKPHLPFIAPEKYWNLYNRKDFSMPENLGVPPGYPDYARNSFAGEIHSYSDVPLKASPKEFSNELNHRLIHGYHASVSYTDRNIGLLLDALEASGAVENTIVVIWADHGWKLGDHSSWCKHTNFECDTRIPLLVRHPGICSARGTTHALTELIDLYPTLCELCGLGAPPHLQGKSFVSVLKGPKTSHRDSAYSSYPHSAHNQSVMGHSLRTSQYRYTEWWSVKDDKILDQVLTDIEADPQEQTSISGKEDLKTQLSKQLRQRVLAARTVDVPLQQLKGR
jgi:iduronate 2-sulfatase